MTPVTAALDLREHLAHLPTPMERADRLGASLGRTPGTTWIKRDDCTGLAAGGNKLRKLEYVVADALAEDCDWLVTLGGPQSNAARMTAAVGRRFGMGCTLVLVGEQPERYSGNLVVDTMLGAEIVWRDPSDPRHEDVMIAAEVERLREAGRRPYAVAVGSSTPRGSLGYVRAAQEILGQLPEVDVVVCGTGSAGTQAGLVAGFGDHARVHGVRVGTRRRLYDRIEKLAADTAALAGLPSPVGRCRLDEDHLGDGYGAHTVSGATAMALAARTEGLLLDPVYTAKAMAGFITACRTGAIRPDQVAVFLHTGGLPGLLSDDHGPWTAGAVGAAEA